jgi:hypothetical protein
VGEETLVMKAVPLRIVQVPVPTVGAVAAMANVPVLHCVMFEPAFAALTGARLMRTISSMVEPHVPLVMVQRSVALVPAGTPVMVVVDKVLVVIVAVPF